MKSTASSLDAACGIEGFKVSIFLDFVILHRGYLLRQLVLLLAGIGTITFFYFGG
jgi:hypothetical protein